MNEKYNVSFRCFFESEESMHFTTHYCPAFPLSDIPRWVDSYKFTHPNCVSVSVKIWFNGGWNETSDVDVDEQ